MTNITTASPEENKSKSCKTLDSFQNRLWEVKTLPKAFKANLCLISSIWSATGLGDKGSLGNETANSECIDDVSLTASRN